MQADVSATPAAGTSTDLSWPSSPPVDHAVSLLSPLTFAHAKERGKQRDKIISLFLSALCFYNMNRNRAAVCKFYIMFSSSKPTNQ